MLNISNMKVSDMLLNVLYYVRRVNNYPNPFNPTTTILFDVPETSFINLSVFNGLGQLVKELENEELRAGHYSRTFNTAGLNLSSGIYYLRLKSNNFIKIKKLTLLK